MGHLLLPLRSLVWVSADTFLLPCLPGEELILAVAARSVWIPMSALARLLRPFSPNSLRAMAACMWRAEGRGASRGREVLQGLKGGVGAAGLLCWEGRRA